MSRSGLRLAWWACGLLGLFVQQQAWGRTLKVTLDQSTGRVAAWLDSKPLEWAGGEPLRVAPGSEIVAEVTHTNTALYGFRIETSETEAPDVAALRAFMPALQAYVPGLVTGALSMEMIPEREAADPIPTELKAIASAMDTVRVVELVTLSALDAMGRDGPFAGDVRRLREATGKYLSAADTTRLRVRDGLLAHLGRLATLLAATTATDASARAGRTALAHANEMLAHVTGVESLVTAARVASDSWQGAVGVVSASKSKTVVLTVEPQASPILQGLPLAGRMRASLDVEPRWPIHPNVGLGLLVSPGSTFPTYDVSTNGGSATVSQTGSVDERVTYGLSLALTPDALYGRRHGFSYWLAELTLNPSENVSAVGLGSAVSWRALKLSGGWLWTKHQAVSGARVEETYGSPEGFVAIAVAGWLR